MIDSRDSLNDLEHRPVRIGKTTISGSIEAMGQCELPWESWMWHPERDARLDAATMARARSLVSGGELRARTMMVWL